MFFLPHSTGGSSLQVGVLIAFRAVAKQDIMVGSTKNFSLLSQEVEKRNIDLAPQPWRAPAGL